MNLAKDKQNYVLESIHVLRNTVNVDEPLEYDVIDEYSEEASEPAKPFPITFHIDYPNRKLYFISIEESFRSRS